MDRATPDEAFQAEDGTSLPPCDGDSAPFYRPDESKRREQAKQWLRIARGKSPE